MTPADLKRPGFFRLALAMTVYVDHATRLNLGIAAVELFFVLSGYWITKMWSARYAQTHQPYFTYLASRAWRLLPVALLTSALAWMVTLAHGSAPQGLHVPHQVFSNLMLIGYRSLGFQANGPAWSLDVEMQFYVLAPVLIALASWRLWTLAAAGVVSLLAWALHDHFTAAPYLAFFAVGILAAAAQWRPSERIASLSLFVGCGAILLCLASPYRSLLLVGRTHGPFSAFTDQAQLALAGLFIPWAIATTARGDTVSDKMLGDLSFAVYLLHWPLLQLIDTRSGSGIHRLAMLGLTTSALGVASVLIWRYFDLPIQRHRAAWVEKRRLPIRSPSPKALAVGRLADGSDIGSPA